MILDYYNLKEQPFGVTPDPRYLYLTRTHREALASLAYGIQNSRGFMSLVASPGMGKTTIVRYLLQQLQGSARIAFLCQTLCRPEDIMRAVLRDLGVADDIADVARMEERLNSVLLEEARLGRKVIIVIDEAQNLDASALEAIRLLSNYETSTDKLMQIVIAGQPQLGERLAAPRLLQLRQRMSIVARLQPLDQEETRLYIAHRLRVAGYEFTKALFTGEAEGLIAQHSEGIPRNINNICFNALSLGCVEKQTTIEADVIREVLKDLNFSTGWWPHSVANAPRRLITRMRKALNLQSSITWKKPLATFVVLLLALGAKWRIDSSDSTTAKAAAVGPTEVHASTITTIQGPSRVPGAPAVGANSPSAILNKDVSFSKRSTKQTQTRLRQQEAPQTSATSDPDQLWKLVKKQNSAAEVELARMYLDGAMVTRNCEQAELLLQAAARRGNAQATELLNDEFKPCPP